MSNAVDNLQVIFTRKPTPADAEAALRRCIEVAASSFRIDYDTLVNAWVGEDGPLALIDGSNHLATTRRPKRSKRGTSESGNSSYASARPHQSETLKRWGLGTPQGHGKIVTFPVTKLTDNHPMTIAVGILCDDGVVVGADREVSLTTHKREERKAHLLKVPNVAIGLVGAGSASLVTLAAQELQPRLSANMTLAAVKRVVDELALEIHDKHISRNPNHALDLLLGIKTTPKGGQREFRLLKVEGTVAVWRDRYDCIGFGYELADYLLSGRYDRRENMTVARGIMVAAQVIKQAKTHTQHSGGQTDVIHVRLGYVADYVDERDIDIHEESAEKFSKIIRPVALAMTDINVSTTKLEDLVGKMAYELNAFRPQAFRDAQRAQFAAEQSPSSPVRISITQASDSSSSVFGVLETSAPPPEDY
jgi:20S proteasome alpha/beta subunit